MVGPGEVDEELEPEVKEECEGKYGEILKVKIVETPGVVETEAVRIFLEFKRQECAIKGISDALNYTIFNSCIFSIGRSQWKIFRWKRS